MGMILETKDEILGLEERRESFIVVDVNRKYPHEVPQPTRFAVQRTLRGDHYEYTVTRDGVEWFNCGQNLHRAEFTTAGCNMLERENQGRPRLSDHIFAAQDGEFEVSKEFLRRLVSFFDKPANRKLLDDGDKH
jgi:hypothetical protein